MKKLWLIETGSYSDYRVVGIFSKRENAVLATEALGFSESDINEWEIDPAMNELNRGYYKFNVIMQRDGTTETCSRLDRLYDLDSNHASIWDRPNAPAYKGKNIPAALSGTVWARNKKHAVKIVNEMRTRMIAENKWKP